MKKWFLITILLCSSILVGLHGQLIENIRLSSSVGVNHVSVEKNNLNENLDFMNFHNYQEDVYINFSALFELRNNLDILLRTDIGSVLKPYDFHLKVYHAPFKYLGFLAGYHYDRLFFEDYGSYHQTKHKDYYVFSQYYYQHKLHSNNFLAGFYFPLSYKRFKAKIEIAGGLNSTSGVELSVLEKRKEGNELRKFDYSIHPDISWFAQPGAELSVDCFNIGNTSLGVLGNVNWRMMKKALDYRQTSYEWTYDNDEVREIENPTHRISHLTWDVGVFVRW